MKKPRLYFIFYLKLITFCICQSASDYFLCSLNINFNQNVHPVKLIEPPPLTVWIHGTLLINKPFFHKAFGSKDILRLAIYINKHFYAGQLAPCLHEQAPADFPLEMIYAFAWSGRLSAQARLDAAYHLYHQLGALAKLYYKKWHCEPKITLITHSHGGNVALNLAYVHERLQKNVKIDRLLLLACPVQKSTMRWVSSSMFDHVYSLYSSLDFVQVIAPQQGESRLPYSQRCFPSNKKIVQAKVRLNGMAVSHAGFVSKAFFKSIPALLDELQRLELSHDSWKNREIILRIKTISRRKNHHKKRLLLRLSSKKREAITYWCQKVDLRSYYL